MLKRANTRLGVGHKAQDQAGGIAEAGDVQKGAIGVFGEAGVGGGARGEGILEDDLAAAL